MVTRWAGEAIRVSLPGVPSNRHRAWVWSHAETVQGIEMRYDAESGRWYHVIATPPEPMWFAVAVAIDAPGGLCVETARFRTRLPGPSSPAPLGSPRRGFGGFTRLELHPVISVRR